MLRTMSRKPWNQLLHTTSGGVIIDMTRARVLTIQLSGITTQAPLDVNTSGMADVVVTGIALTAGICVNKHVWEVGLLNYLITV